MKQFINLAENVVDEAINGAIIASDAVCIHPKNRRIVLRSDIKKVKECNIVTLVSGGGSGHEPFASCFVGKNALAGAVCGGIFASPPSSACATAMNATLSSVGTIVFVLNYTGDRLNFGIAVEKLRAQSSTRIELIYIDDDVALEQKVNAVIGGRGLAGVCLLIHIIGTFSEQCKMEFDELVNISREVISNTATLGVNLEPCALPGQGKMFELSSDEYELGLGIHGEAGIERRKMTPVNEICKEVLGRLAGCNRLHLKKEDPIAILLNNLGSVTQLEISILKGEIIDWFLSNGYNIQCFISGTLMTSLDARGFSITVLRIRNDKWLSCLLDCESAVSNLWKASKINKNPLCANEYFSDENAEQIGLTLGPSVSQANQSLIKSCLIEACKSIVNAEAELNRLDSLIGDGDCGTSMRMAANAILKSTEKIELTFVHPKSLFLQLSKLFETSIGGTSGALYALMLNAAASSFDEPLSSVVLKRALKLALNCIEYYAGAKPGYRTLLDPLDAAANFSGNNWSDLVDAVEDRAQQTANMEAKAGRASYTDKSQQLEPDPGAIAFAIWFRAVYRCYKKSEE